MGRGHQEPLSQSGEVKFNLREMGSHWKEGSLKALVNH